MRSFILFTAFTDEVAVFWSGILSTLMSCSAGNMTLSTGIIKAGGDDIGSDHKQEQSGKRCCGVVDRGVF